MLLAADRQEGVEAGEMTEALTTVAWGLKQLGRASGGMASVSRARMSSAYRTDGQTDRQTSQNPGGQECVLGESERGAVQHNARRDNIQLWEQGWNPFPSST